MIIGVINKASVEDSGMLQLFLQSMREGEDTAFLIRHVLLVATDQIAYNHCMVLQLHCHQLYTDTVLLSPALSIQSTSLINLASTLTLFLGEVLLRGYSFIFTVSFFILIPSITANTMEKDPNSYVGFRSLYWVRSLTYFPAYRI